MRFLTPFSFLQAAFPGVGGFSPPNVWRMRGFYLPYSADVRNHAQPVRELDGSTLPAPVAEIPRGHNILVVEKLDATSARFWHARMTTDRRFGTMGLDPATRRCPALRQLLDDLDTRPADEGEAQGLDFNEAPSASRTPEPFPNTVCNVDGQDDAGNDDRPGCLGFLHTS
jgi:DUF1016 N-terminal domain